jgi:GMP reductase
MRILDDIKLDYQDVLFEPQRCDFDLDSRSKIKLTRPFKFKYGTPQYEGTPIIAANMDSVGTMAMADAFKSYNMAVALHKFYTADDLIKYFKRDNKNLHTFYSMGISDDDRSKFDKVMSYAPIEYVCIDVANGYSPKLSVFVQKLREEYPQLVIMAGNVVTGDMVHELLLKGADIVKIGIGPGSVCTTRKMTGVGYPQFSAVVECANAAHGLENGLICADGGIVDPGDVSKALGAGADFVMCGGIFAGHAECEGELIGEELSPESFVIDTGISVDPDTFKEYFYLKRALKEFKTKGTLGFQTITFSKDRQKVIKKTPTPLSFFKDPANLKMKFHGMSSREAMEQHYGGKADYRAAEGKEVEIPYKGPVKNVIEQILGGIRSTCTYIGARQLKHMSKCAVFLRVNHQYNSVFGS